jgi:hypothetical protein
MLRNEMRTPRFLRIAIPVAGALLVAAGAIAVTASAAGLRVSPLAAATTPSPKAGAGNTAGGSGNASAACQAYMGHLATQLNVSPAKLDAAALAAAKATVQDQVKSGKITQAQADKIEAKLPTASAGFCSGAINELGKAPRASLAKSAYLTAAAAALGVTEAQLKADLKAGQNLSQVAAAQKVSEADFKTKVTASIKAKLDAAVGAKAITQAQEDAQLAKLQAGDPPYWSSTKK